MGRKLILVFVIGLVGLTLNAQNQDQQKRNDIRQILELQDNKTMWDMLFTRMLELLKTTEPYRSELYWKRYQKIISSSYPHFFDAAVEVYAKHLTQEEVAALLEFSQSELGASVLSKNSIMIQDLMQSGASLGTNFNAQIVDEQRAVLATTYSGCLDFKTGRFYYISLSGDTIKIDRGVEYQYEYYKGTTTKHKIEWLDDCRYTLVTIESDSELMQEDLGEFLVNVYQQGPDFYRFISKPEKLDDIYFEGEIFKIE